MSELWHRDEQYLQWLKRYDQDIVCPPPQMSQARAIHNNYCQWLLARLKAHSQWKIVRLEFIGSAYEGLKVGDEIEFDVMVVIDIGTRQWKTYTTNRPTPPVGHFHIFSNPNEFPIEVHASGQELSAKKVAQNFQGMVQKSIDSSCSQWSMKLREHGTAASQVDIFSLGQWYHVDLVPCLEAKIDGEALQFVAKPKAYDDTLWRRSYSITEKNELSGVDGNDNGCRKQCLRILKTIKDRDPVLCIKALTSYYLKTAQLLEIRDVPRHSWGQDQMLIRLMGLMKRLENAMDTGYLECRFNTAMNVLNLDKLDQETRTTIRDRLHVLRTNQREFLNILSMSVLSSG